MEQYLLLGCGKDRRRMVVPTGKDQNFGEGLITLDNNPDRNPDVVWDLENLPLPFGDSIFDEVHAYQVLEHLGGPGDYKQFFGLFSELWRIMKPGGQFYCSYPSEHSEWAWGDPSHKRIITQNQFTFLSQSAYKVDCDQNISMRSDFRYMYKADFEMIYMHTDSFCEYTGLRVIK